MILKPGLIWALTEKKHKKNISRGKRINTTAKSHPIGMQTLSQKNLFIIMWQDMQTHGHMIDPDQWKL